MALEKRTSPDPVDGSIKLVMREGWEDMVEHMSIVRVTRAVQCQRCCIMTEEREGNRK